MNNNEAIQGEAVDQKETSSKSAGKSDKSKLAKKKISKKQKLAAGLIMKEREAKERELFSKADSESRAYERGIRYQLEEKERREWEQDHISKLEAQFAKSRTDWQERNTKQDKWKKFVQAAGRVNPAIQKEINTWLVQWEEKEEYSMEETLSDCQEAEKITQELILLVENTAEVSEPENLINRYKAQIIQLRDLQMSKIDQMTASVMQRADEFANTKNEVLVYHKTDDIKYGLWVNITKNPRIKRIDFLSIALSSDLPKNLALTSVGIRMMHCIFDPITFKYPSDHLTVGGVLFLELLALPPPPKKVKGWTLRQITPLSTNVSRLNYPPSVGLGVEVNISTGTSMGSNAAVLAGWPPLKVSYQLPPDTIVREQIPVIGWWDQESHTWKTSGISDIEFDPPTKTVVFKTIHVTPLAIIQHRLLDLPFDFWQIRPCGKQEATLTVRTKTKKELEFKIGEGYCRLYRSRDPELRKLEEVKFSPVELLQKLTTCGINIHSELADTSDPQLKELLNPKEKEFENKLYKEISEMVPSFAFCWSKWNNQKHFEYKCLLRVRECLDYSHFDDREENMTDENNEQEKSTPWKTCLYQERSCILVKASERSKYNEDLLEGAKIHQHLFHCLQHISSNQSGSESRVRSASAAFTTNIQTMLQCLHLVTFSK